MEDTTEFEDEVLQQSRASKATSARANHRPRSLNSFNSLTALRQRVAWIDNEKSKKEAFIEAHPPRQLVVNGCWNVPVEQRPKGWEKLGVKER